MEQKRGYGKHRFKKWWGKLGQGVGVLKRGAGTPLQIMLLEQLKRTSLLQNSTKKVKKWKPKYCLDRLQEMFF